MNAPLTSPFVDLVLRGVLWSLAIAVGVGALAPELLLLPPGAIATAIGTPLCVLVAALATLWTASHLQPRLGVVLARAFRGRVDLADAASHSTLVSYVLVGLAFALLTLPDAYDWARSRDVLGLAAGHVGRVLVALGIMSAVLTWRAMRRHVQLPVPVVDPNVTVHAGAIGDGAGDEAVDRMAGTRSRESSAELDDRSIDAASSELDERPIDAAQMAASESTSHSDASASPVESPGEPAPPPRQCDGGW